VGRAEILDIDSDISDLKRLLDHEEDSQIWKGVKHQWQIRKELRDRFGTKERTPRDIKTASTIDTFQHQTERLQAYNRGLIVAPAIYVAKCITLLGIMVLLV